MNTFVKVMHVNTCNCAACTPAPTLGIKMPYEEEKKKTAKTKKGPSKRPFQVRSSSQSRICNDSRFGAGT